MNDHEIEQFILTYGRDILRFCRMTAGGTEAGDDTRRQGKAPDAVRSPDLYRESVRGHNKRVPGSRGCDGNVPADRRQDIHSGGYRGDRDDV